MANAATSLVAIDREAVNVPQAIIFPVAESSKVAKWVITPPQELLAVAYVIVATFATNAVMLVHAPVDFLA